MIRKIDTSVGFDVSNIAVVKNSQGAKTLFAICGGSPLSFDIKLMKSADMGDTWEEVVPIYQDDINPSILEPLPSDPGTLVIGSDDPAKPLWLYTEESDTWDYIAGSGLPGAIAPPGVELKPGDDPVWYLPTWYGGIYKFSGTDGPWEQINSGFDNCAVNDFAADPESCTDLYAATAEAWKIMKSPDAGTTWGMQPSNLSASFDVLEIDPNHPSTFWAAKSGYGYYTLYKGTNHGQYWTGPHDFVDPPATGNYTNITDILVKPGNSDAILVSSQHFFMSSGLTGFGVVARTTDGGTTWDKLIAAAGSCLATDPNDPDRVYVGKQRAGQVFQADNAWGFQTLEEISPDEGIEDVQDIEVDNLSNLFVATEEGLWRKDAAGWKKLDFPSYNITSLAMDHSENPSVVFAGSADDGVFVSTDTGETWMPFNNGLGNPGITKLVFCGSTLYASSAKWWDMDRKHSGIIYTILYDAQYGEHEGFRVPKRRRGACRT